MDMKDIRKIEIVAGPGEIAYSFSKDTGILRIWHGAYTELASSSAQHTNIELDKTTWSMEQTYEPD